MKTIFSIIILLTTFVHCFAQNPFTITGTFKDYNGKIYLEYAGHTDSVDVNNGQFKFKGDIELPIKATLAIKTALPLSYTPFIIDPADMVMKVDTSTKVYSGKHHLLVSSTILKGGQTTVMVDDFTRLLVPQIQAAKSQEEQTRIFVSETKAFLKRNPNQIAPLYLISNAQKIYSLDDLKDIYDSLNDKLKSTSYAKSIKNRIDKNELTITGTQIQDFEQVDTFGKTISIKSLRGKYVLIDFWASWCVPCREENPNLKIIYNKYKGKDFEILAISLDKYRKDWLKAIKDDKLTWLHVSDLQGWDNVVSNLFKINSVPDNILIDKEGKIIGRSLRGKNLEQRLNLIFNND